MNRPPQELLRLKVRLVVATGKEGKIGKINTKSCGRKEEEELGQLTIQEQIGSSAGNGPGWRGKK